MKQICVIGVGYVGLVTAACFADLGNRVVALDVDEQRVANLKKGIMPIYEPGLEELVGRNIKGGRLSFTTSYAEGLRGAEFAFIAVGTPSSVDGNADLQYVDSAARSIARNMAAPLILLITESKTVFGRSIRSSRIRSICSRSRCSKSATSLLARSLSGNKESAIFSSEIAMT